MAVLDTLRGQNLRPRLLGVIEHEGDELHQRLFGLVAPCVGTTDLRGWVGTAAHACQRQKISLKYQAQHQQDKKAADPDVDSAKIETSATAAIAAVVSAVFQVVATSAGCPAHEFSPC